MSQKNSSEIIETMDYEKFKILECNRKIKEPYLRTLIFSIQAQNMLKFRPILVDAQMNVIDGQHRLEVARRLRIPIYYQVNKSANEEDIIILNNNQKKWDIDDYLNYYSSTGKDDYCKLFQYTKSKNLPTTIVMRLIGTDGGRSLKNFKLGKFKFPSPERLEFIENLQTKIDAVYQLLHKYIITDNKFLSSSRLLIAFTRLLKHPKVKFDILMKKLTIKCESMHSCTTEQDYLSMLISIYNWKNQDPISSSIDADEEGIIQN